MARPFKREEFRGADELPEDVKSHLLGLIDQKGSQVVGEGDISSIEAEATRDDRPDTEIDPERYAKITETAQRLVKQDIKLVEDASAYTEIWKEAALKLGSADSRLAKGEIHSKLQSIATKLIPEELDVDEINKIALSHSNSSLDTKSETLSSRRYREWNVNDLGWFKSNLGWGADRQSEAQRATDPELGVSIRARVRGFR